MAEALRMTRVGELRLPGDHEEGVASGDVQTVSTCNACGCLVAEHAYDFHLRFHNEIAAAMNEALFGVPFPPGTI